MVSGRLTPPQLLGSERWWSSLIDLVYILNSDVCCLGEPFVVVVSPLLFESGRLLGVMKKIVVVKW